MANIGRFKKVGSEYQGQILTLSVQAKNVRIAPAEGASNDAAPSHRVFVGRAEIVQELGEARQLPLQLHVRDEARYEDEVHRPFARDLVGDVHVAAQRVLRLSFHRYGWQIVRSRGTWSEQGGATEPRKTTRQTLLRFRRMKSPLPA